LERSEASKIEGISLKDLERIDKEAAVVILSRLLDIVKNRTHDSSKPFTESVFES
jgi:hypothetical protein